MRIFLVFIFLFSFIFANNLEEFENEFSEEFQATQTKADPLKYYNKAMTSFNDVAFDYVLVPVLRGYNHVIEPSGRIMINNFFKNLKFPQRFINNLLQGKFQNSVKELFGFVVNTTIGIGGFGNAKKELFGFDDFDEDFGQTLGFYGVGSAVPIVLPILGPSNLRDCIGRAVDVFTSPITYLDNHFASLSLNVLDKGNEVSFQIKQMKAMKKNILDLYPFLQDYYDKKRDREIKE